MAKGRDNRGRDDKKKKKKPKKDKLAAAADLGLGVCGCCASPLPGPAGNVEYFLWLHPGAPAPDAEVIRAAVEAGPR